MKSINKYCNCTYYQLKYKGFKPINHNPSCHLYRPLVNSEECPFKEEWLHKEDIELYNKMNEKRINGIKKYKTKKV